VDAHRPVPRGLDLAEVFCHEEVRTVMSDWCIRHHNRFYQIQPENRPLPRPKDRVVVRTRLDGTQELLYRGKRLAFRVLDGPPVKPAAGVRPAAVASAPQPKPAPTHPWRRYKPAPPAA